MRTGLCYAFLALSSVGLLLTIQRSISQNMLCNAVMSGDRRAAYIALRMGAVPEAYYRDYGQLLKDPSVILDEGCPLISIATLNAYKTGDLSILKMLLDKGALKGMTKEQRDSLLLYHRPMECKVNWRIVQALVQHGADPRTEDNYLLRLAVNEKNRTIVKFLVQMGADSNIVPRDG